MESDSPQSVDSRAADPGEEGESDQRVDVGVGVEVDEPPDCQWIGERLRAVVQRLGVSRAAVDVVVVDDAMMTELNERYARHAGTTDVLSFDMGEGQAGAVEGELYVCLDEARRQAKKHGHDVNRELLLYAVHGLLHLVGYDDHEAEAHRRMHAKEDELLEAVGVGKVYARSGAPGSDACVAHDGDDGP